MEIWQLILLFFAGIAAGFINVMAGGGSLLTVPAMLMLDIPGPVANGTNRIAILGQNAVAVFTFFKKGYSDFRLSFSLALASIPGAMLGAYFGSSLDGVWFDRIVAIVMIVVMFLMARDGKKSSQTEVASAQDIPKYRLVAGHGLMLVAGFWGGFILLGVGFILMPILHRVLGLDLVRVNMHKTFIILVYTIAAFSVFISQVEILWIVGLSLAIGNSIGGWLGASTSIKSGDKFIRQVFNVVMVCFIVKLLFF